MIRVILPYHLQTLARCEREIIVDVTGPITVENILAAIEAKHPVLCGTMRDHGTLKRRKLVRFFACAEDVSHDPSDRLLPMAIASGEEAFYVIGAIAGG